MVEVVTTVDVDEGVAVVVGCAEVSTGVDWDVAAGAEEAARTPTTLALCILAKQLRHGNPIQKTGTYTTPDLVASPAQNLDILV